MAEPRAPGTLDEAANVRFQKAEWRFERVSWVAIAAVLAASLLGVCGAGPLSHARAASADGAIALEHERFGRREQRQELTVEVAPDAAAGGRVRIWVDRRIAEALRIEDVQPEPVAVASERGRLVYDIAASGRVRVTLYVTVQQMGLQRGRVGLAGGPSVPYWQLVYP